jgi:hypothetical protein
MRTSVIFLIAYVFPGPSIAQEVRLSPEVKPPPVTLSELKALPGPTPDHPCPFAPVDPDSSKPTPITLADTTLLFLPQGWQLLPQPESDPESDETRVRTPDGSRIHIALERNGAKGRSFLSYGPGKALPRGESCTLDSGDLGAIWTFYGPDPAALDGLLPFVAFADLMAPGPRWYRVTISSKTTQERELVARRITNLLLHRSVLPGGIPL